MFVQNRSAHQVPMSVLINLLIVQLCGLPHCFIHIQHLSSWVFRFSFDRLGFPESLTGIVMVANVGLDSDHSGEERGRAKGQLCKVNTAFMATCIQKYYFLCDCVFYRSVMECVPYWSHTIVSWQRLSILPSSASDSERLRTYCRRRRTTMQRWRYFFTFVHSYISKFAFTVFYFEIHCFFF